MSTTEEAAVLSRRRLLSRLSIGLGALAGAVVAVPILSYLLSPLLNRAPNTWRDVGRVDDFRIDQTVEVSFEEPSPLPWAGQTARTAAWLRRTGEASFVAFAVNCTHLGCPVNWRPEARLFLCPCHGGVFYADGRVAGGPPPRPLVRYDVRVRDGIVQIQTRNLPVSSA
ncbi:MAG TPA: Rieske (2Fe-2S) protein [Chloroflexota bacterium]|jgi:menaquinol-cytochrome c reductase iron-sulfur subunit|nr:Rieske (2Fe-2S) protein [Chloroflexota bacterium]